MYPTCHGAQQSPHHHTPPSSPHRQLPQFTINTSMSGHPLAIFPQPTFSPCTTNSLKHLRPLSPTIQITLTYPGPRPSAQCTSSDRMIKALTRPPHNLLILAVGALSREVVQPHLSLLNRLKFHAVGTLLAGGVVSQQPCPANADHAVLVRPDSLGVF